jgi:hypothetical protein
MIQDVVHTPPRSLEEHTTGCRIVEAVLSPHGDRDELLNCPQVFPEPTATNRAPVANELSSGPHPYPGANETA